jgi:hypothetical protein
MKVFSSWFFFNRRETQSRLARPEHKLDSDAKEVSAAVFDICNAITSSL